MIAVVILALMAIRAASFLRRLDRHIALCVLNGWTRAIGIGTVMLSKDLRTLITHGYYVDPVCVAALSPYVTKDLERFGKYTLNLAQVPDPVDYHTPVVSQVSLEDPDRPGKQTSSEQREVAV